MKTFNQILTELHKAIKLNTFPCDNISLSPELGVAPSSPAAWKHRDSVPPEYWRGIVKLAKEYRVSGVTLEALAKAAEK